MYKTLHLSSLGTDSSSGEPSVTQMKWLETDSKTYKTYKKVLS